MAYSGRFIPKYPNKYLGDPSNIFFRSLLERRMMMYFDENSTIVEWSSEEIIIPYVSPLDNRLHRYFPDFFIRVKNNQGMLEEMLIEVKPKSQTAPPVNKKGKINKRYLKEVATWGVNEAKWKAADEYCKDRNWKFKIITEKEIYGTKK